MVDAIDLIEKARVPSDLWGGEDPKTVFRRLAREVHPDLSSDPRAEEAFKRLNSLWDKQERGVRFTIRSKKVEYDIEDLIGKGDIANIYASGDGHYIKMVRSPRDNDLMQREVRALKQIEPAPFFPELLEGFRHRDPDTKQVRRVNVFKRPRERFVSLADVHDRYPELDPKDAAWMWRRLLIAIDLAHRSNVVHGAVIPQNVLIAPAEHGLMLIDWCFSVVDGDGVIPAMTSRPSFYPDEIRGKETPGVETDIYMATKCMEYLMGDLTPAPLRSFIAGCTLDNRSARPHDAGKLQLEFDDLIERMWGPKKFRPFTA